MTHQEHKDLSTIVEINSTANIMAGSRIEIENYDLLVVSVDSDTVLTVTNWIENEVYH